MKYLIFLLISFQVLAASYLPKSKVGESTDGLTVYSKKSKCEKFYSEPCINISGKGDISISKIRPATWLKEQADSCEEQTQEECREKLALLECDSDGFQPIMVYEEGQKEIYCSKFRREKLVVDDAKKAAKDAERARKAQERADRKAEIQELRDHIQDVNSSDLPGWHKKILRRLIRELKD